MGIIALAMAGGPAWLAMSTQDIQNAVTKEVANKIKSDREAHEGRYKKRLEDIVSDESESPYDRMKAKLELQSRYNGKPNPRLRYQIPTP